MLRRLYWTEKLDGIDSDQEGKEVYDEIDIYTGVEVGEELGLFKEK